jgi:Na+/H+ antiporter NhaD/arsenite permease-like protein
VKRSLWALFGLACVAVLCGAASAQPELPALDVPLGEQLPLLSVIPFALLLLAIALFPLFAPHWWEENANKGKVAALFTLPLVALLIFHFGHSGLEALAERLFDYLSLMALLTALFVVCGGILVEGWPPKSLSRAPFFNTACLATGAILANVIGTTGASMILIRPLIRANEHRRRVAHIPIFVIFIVANCGGLLTPLGDPPLFLGYLAGVPFGWTLHLFPVWAVVNGALLVTFFIWDQIALSRDRRAEPPPSLAQDTAPTSVLDSGPRTPHSGPSLRIHGLSNILLLLAIIAAVFVAGRGLGNNGFRWPFGVLEGLLVAAALASMFLTDARLREKNRFSFKPLVEVAVLFAGIFIAMTPALLILNAHGARLGLTEPWQYFWASGLLSSVLDNTPTYLAFASLAAGSQGIPIQGHYLSHVLEPGTASNLGPIVAAISCGCVFMGALTYIGNAPNFMVRAIAQESNVRMPGFLGYILYAVTILIPLFALVTILLPRV